MGMGMMGNEMEEKDREACEICDLIQSASSIVRQAILMDEASSKKALRDAAKTLLQKGIDRLDESVGASLADDEDEE